MNQTPFFFRRSALIILGALLLYAALGFLLVPALVRHYLPRLLAAQLPVAATVGEIRFNPFLFRLEAEDLSLDDSTGQALFGLQGLAIDFELASLVHRAWTFAEVVLHGARLELVLEPDGRLNLQRLLQALPESGDGKAAPPRVILERVAIEAARVRYTDAHRVEPVSIELGPLDLQLHEIATIPDYEGPYTLSADLPGGATAAWAGRATLHPLGSSGSIEVEGLRPAAFWELAAPLVALDAPEGVAALGLDYSVAFHDGDLLFETRAMRLAVRDLRLLRRGAREPMLQLATADFTNGRFSLVDRVLAIDDVRIADGAVGVRLDPSGALDWASLVTAEPETVPAPARAPGSAPFAVELPGVVLEGVALNVYDRSRNSPLGVSGLARQAEFAASLALGGAQTEARVSNLQLELEQLAASTGIEQEPLASIAQLNIHDGSLDLGALRFAAQKVSLEGVRTAIRRHADGSIREVHLVSTPDPAMPLPITHAASAWQATVGELLVSQIDADYADEVSDPPIELPVRGGSLALEGVNTGSAAPVALALELPFAAGGRLAVTGRAAGDGSSADLRMRAERLSLLPFAPLVTERTTLELRSGTLGADVEVAFRAGAGAAPALQVRGTLGADDLLLAEAAGGERFLSWRSAAATGLALDVGPNRLQLRELRLVEPGAKIVINQDRSTNLDLVMRAPIAASPPPAEGDVAAQAAFAPGGDMPVDAEVSAEPEPVSPPSAATFPVKIDRVRIDAGTVDFADFSLVLPFAARIESFKGVARGITSAADSRGTLAFGGRVGEFGEAGIDGQLALFDPTRFTDIEVSFRNVALSPLSPYSATFAGRTIAGGSVDLGLEYRIDEGRLVGDNEVVLQDLQLGDKVESPGAIALPLDLAVALLTDAEGRIDLAIPVTGDVTDPQFSYGRLIGRALRNLISGVVTAPFRALGSLLGGKDDEALQTVRFKSGSAELMPREREQVAAVAAALIERPQLGVAVVPGSEAERDGYAVRRLEVRREHATELGFGLEPGEDPGPVSYTEPDSQRALEVLLERRRGDQAADRFAADWAGRNAGAQPERVNAALALIGRGAGTTEFYRAMYLELVNSQPEDTATLQTLAQARAQVVAAELVARGVASSRVDIAPPRPLAQANPAGVLLPLELVPVDRAPLAALPE